MDLIKAIDLFTIENIDEMFKKVIRKGKVKKKTICPVGVMKAKGNKCVLMTPAERKNRLKAAKKTGKKLHTNLGIQKKALKKRAKSLRKRAMSIPDKGAPSLKPNSMDNEGE